MCKERNKIIEEHYERICRMCKGIASVESLYHEDLLGPAAEGLISAADAIIAKNIDASRHKAYIDACVRNAVRAYLIQEQKRGFTGLNEEVPDLIGIQDPLAPNSSRTTESTVDSGENIEQDLITRDEVEKRVSRLPSGYQEVMKLKAEDPFASNAEIARRLGKDEEAIKSIIRRARKYFDPFS